MTTATLPTHRQLCEDAARWIRSDYDVSAYVEPSTPWGNGEHPDVFGVCRRSLEAAFDGDGRRIDLWPGMMVVLEAKASAEDFRADLAKPWRQRGRNALGHLRLYVSPPHIIEAHDITEDFGWGLVWIEDGAAQVVIAPAVQQMVDAGRGVLLLDKLASTSRPRSPGKAGRVMSPAPVGDGSASAKLSAELRDRVSVYVRATITGCTSSEVKRGLVGEGYDLNPSHIAHDARLGLIPKVVAEPGEPAYLVPADSKGVA